MTPADALRGTIALWIATSRPTELAHWRNCMTNARLARTPAWRHAMLNRAAWHRRMAMQRGRA